MKRLILLVLVALLIPVPSLAITWVTANQVTVAWDAVTVDEKGQTIDPAVYKVEYDCFLDNVAHSNPVGIGRYTDAQATTTLVQEGEFIFGCKAVKVKISDGTDVSESPIAWTDNPDVCLGNDPFGLRYFVAPQGPIGYRSVSGG